MEPEPGTHYPEAMLGSGPRRSVAPFAPSASPFLSCAIGESEYSGGVYRALPSCAHNFQLYISNIIKENNPISSYILLVIQIHNSKTSLDETTRGCFAALHKNYSRQAKVNKILRRGIFHYFMDPKFTS